MDVLPSALASVLLAFKALVWRPCCTSRSLTPTVPLRAFLWGVVSRLRPFNVPPFKVSFAVLLIVLSVESGGKEPRVVSFATPDLSLRCCS